GFARRALGPLGGFATGIAILIEYAIAPAAIAVFIGGYVEALAPIQPTRTALWNHDAARAHPPTALWNHDAARFRRGGGR
ncbi:MAG: hypothetical protein ACRDSE_17270, partial [Pseudonocardiaceae bacterium]